ncbi:sigma-70 family RNA polymerase sigma factor [Gramella jeungdoensis]|uniref:Sigma-70 family RNA polymerase sigma factor n=1 Tax=Gramella jeungdoensis TaxID=708091 RepID=A0ABT0Z3M7_9FLAO|nr:sigma-70 family RNA polymerase sigma factor [Gramella jeungdoensis]MCM8569354.1 sigma-70 family RNA polymerase sigma factor [Gramella jeungdoensis]
MELNKYKDISEQWLEYKDALNNYILKIVKDPDTANSLSHEVLMKVYSSCCSGREIRNIRSWLFQIAYNTCMDYFKKENKNTDLQTEIKESEEEPVYQEAGEFVEPLLGLIPSKYSEPLKLADIRGLKQQEVAEKLDLSLTATKSRIQRARQMLKEKIMECVHIEVDGQGNLMAFNIKGTCQPLKDHLKKCK